MKLDGQLHRLRKEKGLSQADVAEKLGISRQAVSRWEIGAAVPTVENLKALSELFEVPLERLMLGGDNSAKAYTPHIVEDSVSPLLTSEETQLQGEEPPLEDGNLKVHAGRSKLFWGMIVAVVLIVGIVLIWMYPREDTPSGYNDWLSELDVDHNASQAGMDFQFEE